MTTAGARALDPPRSLPHCDQLLCSCGVNANGCIELCLCCIALHGYRNALHDLWCVITHHVTPNHLQHPSRVSHTGHFQVCYLRMPDVCTNQCQVWPSICPSITGTMACAMHHQGHDTHTSTIIATTYVLLHSKRRGKHCYRCNTRMT